MKALNDLMERATGGKWHQCGGGNWHIISDQHHMQTCRTANPVHFGPDGKSRAFSGTDEEQANAALIVAAVNHIGPLVEALEQAHSHLADLDKLCESDELVMHDITETLARLEEDLG